MAPSFPYLSITENLSRDLSSRGVRLHYDPYLSLGSDWLPSVLQGQGPQPEDTPPLVERGGRGEALQILQQGNTQRGIRTASICKEGVAVTRGGCKRFSIHGAFRSRHEINMPLGWG